MERFLSAVRAQVRARAEDVGSPYGLECEVAPATSLVVDTARDLGDALKGLVQPLNELATTLREMLKTGGGEEIGQHRLRAEAALRGIERRAKLLLPNWIQALSTVGTLPPSGYVDWLGVERFAAHRDALFDATRRAMQARIREFIAWITDTELFSPELYYLSQLPAEMDSAETVSVVIMALVLSILATLYPSWRASRLDPVEALRYE